MPAIQFSGLASGLDTDAIIGALVEVERIPVLRLEEDNRNLRSKSNVIDRLSSSLSDLANKAEALGELGDFLSYTGSISDDSVGKVTASGEAVAGSYNLEVSQLATAQRTYSDPIADKTAALSASAQTLSFTIDGETTDVDIAADSSLEAVVGAINGSGAGVTAGILFDGTNYRLQVVGNETGEDNAITFNDTGLGLNLEGAGNTVQSALNANFKLDGFDVSTASNLVSDVLPGVTLELKEETTSPVTIEVAPDSAAVESKVKSFVDAYNSVFGLINSQVGEGKGEDTLNGDSSLRSVESSLSSLITGVIPGVTGVGGGDAALSQIGIQTQTDGTLVLDSEDFQEAIGSGFRQVGAYFAGDPAQGTDGISALMESVVESLTDTTDGLLTIRKDGIQSEIKSNEDDLEDKEAFLTRYEESLRTQYSLLESTVSELNSQGQYLAQFLQT